MSVFSSSRSSAGGPATVVPDAAVLPRAPRDGPYRLTPCFVDADRRERPLIAGQVQQRGEAAGLEALAILGDHPHGDFPRAWRLVDAFERKFLSGDFTEHTIDARAVAQWVERRETVRAW